MGEVYRATDTRLKRRVAVKILPESLAADPDRLARFEREAKVLASLNDPHIATVYGFEDGSGVKALVMELVEGRTLADRIAQAPIPLDEALPIASSGRSTSRRSGGNRRRNVNHLVSQDVKPRSRVPAPGAEYIVTKRQPGL